MRRLGWLALFMFLALAGAWWFTRTDSGAREAEAEAETETGTKTEHDAARLVLVDAADAQASAARLPATDARTTAPGAGTRNDGSLLVQVIDANGAYVRDVQIGVVRDEQRGSRDMLSARTHGAAGIARFENFAQRVDPLNPRARAFVHLAVVGCESVGEVVELQDLPPEPLLLKLPACGRVVVLVHDSEGQAVHLRGVRIAEQANVDEDGNILGVAEFAPGTMDAGRAEYPFVPLGLELFVQTVTRSEVESRRGAGPTVAGERVTFDIDLGSPHPILVARLVDARGEPFASSKVKCRISLRWGSAGIDRSENPDTDHDGRLRIELPAGSANGLSGSLRLRPLPGGADEFADTIVVLDSRIRPGLNELGDIVIGGSRTAATGRVVDDRGMPVERALIDVFAPRIEDGVEVLRMVAEVGGKSGEDGWFSAAATPQGGRYRLRASRRGYVDGLSEEYVASASNVRIELTRCAKIAGSARIDAAHSGAKLWACARRASDTPDLRELFRDRERAQVAADGSFLLDEVRPGTCDVAILRDGEFTPLAVVEGIALRPGETAVDGRLAAIELRRE